MDAATIIFLVSSALGLAQEVVSQVYNKLDNDKRRKISNIVSKAESTYDRYSDEYNEAMANVGAILNTNRRSNVYNKYTGAKKRVASIKNLKQKADKAKKTYNAGTALSSTSFIRDEDVSNLEKDVERIVNKTDNQDKFTTIPGLIDQNKNRRM